MVGWFKWCKASKVSLLVDADGLPVDLEMVPGNQNDVISTEKVLKSIPKGSYLTADKAYDIPWFRVRLIWLGIKGKIPYRNCWYEHLKKMTSGKPLEPSLVYHDRWRVERTFAWFCQFKRLNIRYERHAYLYNALWNLAAAVLLLKRIFG